jgi:hypothetical protein
MTPTPAPRPADGMTMDGMHAKPKDHLWVLGIIAGFAMYDVWNAWTMLGNKSGFAHGTGWTLTIIADAYWGYALWAWFKAPGRKSRRFAMWTAAAIFVMSAVSQAASHLAADRMPPSAVVVFVSILPVTVVAMIAVLVHLRQLDRAEATQAEEAARKAERARTEAAAAGDERTALRAQLEDARAAVEPLLADLETARSELARVTAKADTLTRKLATATARKQGAATGRKRAPATARKPEPVTGSATAPEDSADETANVDKEALVLRYLAEGYSASKAGIKAGLSDSRGRQIARDLAKAAPQGVDERTEG